MLKIKALTIGRFYPPHHGGIERHIELLLQGLSRYIQADSLVVNNHFSHETIIAPNRRTYLVPSLGTFASTPLCPTMPFLARKLLHLYHYDILHLHLPNPMAHLIAYALPKKIKLVITWHSDIIRQKKLLYFYEPFLKMLLKRADAVTAATPKHFTSSKLLSQNCDPKKFHVVPFGIDTQQFVKPGNAQLIRQQYPGKNIIFALGRHVYYKGFEYLIQAMQRIDNTILLLGGSGPLTSQLKALANSLQLNDKIIFLGALADNQLASYYHAVDIFCMPSVEKSEALGLVQMEAMACAKPVVCCELGNGVTYINQHNVTGLVVAPRDIDALAVALNSLLTNPSLRQSLGTAGQHFINAEYTLDCMWDKMVQLYQSLL